MDWSEMKEIDARIKAIRKAAEELKDFYGSLPAVNRNAARILASVKMLEINVSDLFMVE